MISCKLHHLESRCRERGYTINEVRSCIVSQDGDSIVVDEAHPSYPRPKLNKHSIVAPVRGEGAVSFVEKARNFAVATAKHVAAGMPTCSDEEIIRRHDICMGCEFFKNNSCGKCGCPISRDKKFISKLAWADQSCPVGKWGPA